MRAFSNSRLDLGSYSFYDYERFLVNQIDNDVPSIAGGGGIVRLNVPVSKFRFENITALKAGTMNAIGCNFHWQQISGSRKKNRNLNLILKWEKYEVHNQTWPFSRAIATEVPPTSRYGGKSIGLDIS